MPTSPSPALNSPVAAEESSAGAGGALVAIIAAIGIIVLFPAINMIRQGGRYRRNTNASSKSISEEERMERRRRALLRFDGNGNGGESVVDGRVDGSAIDQKQKDENDDDIKKTNGHRIVGDPEGKACGGGSALCHQAAAQQQSFNAHNIDASTTGHGQSRSAVIDTLRREEQQQSVNSASGVATSGGTRLMGASDTDGLDATSSLAVGASATKFKIDATAKGNDNQAGNVQPSNNSLARSKGDSSAMEKSTKTLDAMDVEPTMSVVTSSGDEVGAMMDAGTRKRPKEDIVVDAAAMAKEATAIETVAKKKKTNAVCTEEGAANDTDIVIANSSKQQRRRSPPPPAQILCETLSAVCNARVTVSKGDGSWGGEGWVVQRKRLASEAWKGSSKSDIVLPLIDHQCQKPKSEEEEWVQLNSALEAIVASSSPAKNPFRTILVASYSKRGLVATAASWHGKTHGHAARDLIDNAMRLYGLGKDDCNKMTRDGLGRCLSTMTQFTAKVLSSWLEADVSSSSLSWHQDQEEEESDGEDLFTEYYNSAETLSRVTAAASSNATDTSALGELIDLCGKQNATLVLTRRLLLDIMAQPSDGSRLAKEILQRALDRLLVAAPDRVKSSSSFDSIVLDLAAVSHLVTNSVDVAKSLTGKMQQEINDATLTKNDGSAFELSSMFRTLLSLGAYTLPPVGFERGKGQCRFYDVLKSCDAFPLGAYASPYDQLIAKVQDEARSVMSHTRSEICRILGQCMRKKGGDGKDVVFRWLGQIVLANEMHTNMIQEQLLDERDGVHALLSSRPFLLGVAFSVLEMCTSNLMQAYEKNGVGTFDTRYLMSTNGAQLFSSDERRLGDASATAEVIENVPRSFSGATEFFFTASSLLRVSLFPGMRIRNEHASKYKSTFAQLSQMARSKDKTDNDNNPQLPETYKKIAAGLMGWDTCMDDRDIVVRIVDFSILQLRFLADLVSENRGGSVGAQAVLGLLPETMCLQPAQYIAHIATHFQRFLSPTQAEDAVRYATVLLGSGINLSVQVRTELMRISMAFVRASVQREVARQRRKRRAGRYRQNLEEDDNDFIDRRGLDIYTSLDKNDHGVVVFASPVASSQLGPALLQTFVAMEAVEGLDVERDNIQKNMVQDEIADLILRLWVHPSGEFRRSITTLDATVLNSFFRSVVASISIDSDSVFQTILDIRDALENQQRGYPLHLRMNARLDSSYVRLPSFLGALRRLLLLLSYLSQDENIAAILGNGTASSDLGIMIMSLLDKFTASDGGTNPQVDFRIALKCAASMAAPSQTSLSESVKELLDARTFAMTEFGLDVSVIAHLLLALAARWVLAANQGRQENCPALINAIISHDDFDIEHFRNVCNRLVIASQKAPVPGSEDAVIQADGYVDSSLWTCYDTPGSIGLEDSCRQRKGSASQDQLTHTTINGIAGTDQIIFFLDELERESRQRIALNASKTTIAKSDEELLLSERQLLMEPGIEEEGYTENLKEWVVSSDSFGKDHFYCSNAKTSSNLVLGKVLMKDARRCWKDLPRPHPNASVFVCYSEERMDMCRAMIVGASGTPYSMGVFLFDICYPQLYPAAAPMVHFMTTGGGQVRFSPNLYNDGKVCISLLGTTNAWDESQRWNKETSSLAQVLLSIQSQILDVAEPYFTEGGGHGGLEGTAAGQRGSARYNNALRLSTLRHAIIEPLKFPPKGFEDVTRRHFAMCRKRIMVQAKVWTLASKGTELQGRFVKAYSELQTLLSSNKLARESWEIANLDDMDNGTFGALRPLSDDLQALQLLDRNLYDNFSSALVGSVSGQSNTNKQTEEDFNVVESEELNEAMLARALELSLQER